MPGDPTEFIFFFQVNFFLFLQHFLNKITLLMFLSKIDFHLSLILSARVLHFSEIFEIEDLNVSLKLVTKENKRRADLQ